MEYIILEICLIVLGLALAESIIDDTILLPFVIDHTKGDYIKVSINKRTKQITYSVK